MQRLTAIDGVAQEVLIIVCIIWRLSTGSDAARIRVSDERRKQYLKSKMVTLVADLSSVAYKSLSNHAPMVYASLENLENVQSMSLDLPSTMYDVWWDNDHGGDEHHSTSLSAHSSDTRNL